MQKTSWLEFYNEMIVLDEMPYNGICPNLWKNYSHEMETDLILYMKPEDTSYFNYWADPESNKKEFSPQRQNIVLLMAALNNEL